MLQQEMIETIIAKVMAEYSKQNDGSVGWTKDDIMSEVMNHGGDIEDVYRTMALGIDLCLTMSDESDPKYS